MVSQAWLQSEICFQAGGAVGIEEIHASVTLDVDPTPIPITYGQSVRGQTANDLYGPYSVDVPADADRLVVRVTAGRGALDREACSVRTAA